MHHRFEKLPGQHIKLPAASWLILSFLASLALVLAGCANSTEDGGAKAPPETKRLTFMAGYKPQANLPFVAAYVAQENGYFREQDLEVDIRHAGQGEHLKLLLAGDVQVTTADSEDVLTRRSDPGVPIKAIALFGQKGQQAFLTLDKSGIQSPRDWEGKKFGYKLTQPASYLALVKASGANRSKIQEVRVGYDPRVLTEGQVDVLAVFKSNEPDIVESLGFKTRLFDPADYGVSTMGLTYIASDDYIKKDPDALRRFLKATMKGLDFAAKNEDQTLDIIMKYAPKESREHQRFMLRAELKDARNALTQKNGLGWMADAQWKALYDQLIEYSSLPKPFDYRTAYDDRFLKEAYKGGKLQWP